MIELLLQLVSVPRGLGFSHIYYDDFNSQWRLQSLRNPDMYLLLDDRMPRAMPIGRQVWTLGRNLSMCAKDEGAQHLLTFSGCSSTSFTCNNGECVELR